MELQDILDEKNLEELRRKDEIIYFNLLPDKDYSNVSKEHLSKVSEGDSHAIVGDDLYAKLIGGGKIQYGILQRGFLKSKEDIP